ncbi:MAG: SgcJ/EcaC family oxidoreductase [Acidobacteriia bacterium]|nr:SgcJ/EcaC family oxidoreductase [Terriglobia bacterium]
MKTTSFSLAGVALVLAFQMGCSQAPPPAPPDTRAADEQAIREGEAQWVKDFAAKDVDKVLSHYADDAASMIPDMALMTGHDAIRAGLKEEFSDPNASLDFHPTKVEVSKASDLAYSQGVYTFTSTDPKTKKKMTESGGYVEVYKKQADGSWKVVEDIATQAAPPAPVKAAK